MYWYLTAWDQDHICMYISTLSQKKNSTHFCAWHLYISNLFYPSLNRSVYKVTSEIVHSIFILCELTSFLFFFNHITDLFFPISRSHYEFHKLFACVCDSVQCAFSFSFRFNKISFRFFVWPKAISYLTHSFT